MRFSELKRKISIAVFFDYHVQRLFPGESKNAINMQLFRFAKRGDLLRIKRGLYAFTDRKFDDLVLAQMLYQPSYISLETALHIYGVIPDVAAHVTSLTTITSKTVSTRHGAFLYSKISKDLYFGYESIKDALSDLYYPVAHPEKALLDYIYIRKLKHLDQQRADQSEINRNRIIQYAAYFPEWVKKVLNE